MLDSDIARLYGMETKRINQQVARNPIKFPERYVFQLTAEEVELLRSQDATLNNSEHPEVIENQKGMLTPSRSHYATLNANPDLKSQNATSKTARGKNIKYLPYANDTVLTRLSERNPGVTCDIYMQSGRYYSAIECCTSV